MIIWPLVDLINVAILIAISPLSIIVQSRIGLRLVGITGVKP